MEAYASNRTYTSASLQTKSGESLTIVLVVPVDQGAHLVVPQLDCTIVQRRGEQRGLGVCPSAPPFVLAATKKLLLLQTIRHCTNCQRLQALALTECDALDSRRFALELQRQHGSSPEFHDPRGWRSRPTFVSICILSQAPRAQLPVLVAE